MAIAAVRTSNLLGKSQNAGDTQRLLGLVQRSRQDNDPAKLEKEAQRFVAHAFFGTILKQMHDSPWRSEMFSGGKAGRSFEALLDDRLADRMACKPTSRKLVQSIIKSLEKPAKKASRMNTGEDTLSNGPSRTNSDGSSETTQPASDPVDAVLDRAAGHLKFLSQSPRIDLKG